MKRNIAILLMMVLAVVTAQAQTLKELRDSAGEKMFDVAFLTRYANALKKQQKGNEKEYTTVANNLAMITSFSWWQANFDGMRQKGVPVQKTDAKGVLKAKMPLTALHKAELEYIVAAEAKDYNGMRKQVAAALEEPMPDDNMVDRISVSSMLSYLIDFGTEAQACDYKAFLENFVKKSEVESSMVQLAKSTIKDTEGFIMIKEWEAKHPGR